MVIPSTTNITCRKRVQMTCRSSSRECNERLPIYSSSMPQICLVINNPRQSELLMMFQDGNKQLRKEYIFFLKGDQLIKEHKKIVYSNTNSLQILLINQGDERSKENLICQIYQRPDACKETEDAKCCLSLVQRADLTVMVA